MVQSRLVLTGHGAVISNRTRKKSKLFNGTHHNGSGNGAFFLKSARLFPVYYTSFQEM